MAEVWIRRPASGRSARRRRSRFPPPRQGRGPARRRRTSPRSRQSPHSNAGTSAQEQRTLGMAAAGVGVIVLLLGIVRTMFASIERKFSPAPRRRSSDRGATIASRSASQSRDLREPLFQIEIEFAIRRIMPVVDRGEFVIGVITDRLLDTRADRPLQRLDQTPVPTPARRATRYAGPSAALVRTIGCL